jgi:hypothetical protein
MWPLAPTRIDAIAWAVAIALGAIGTAVASLAGARLGAALTLGGGLMVAAVVAGLIVDARSHREPVLADPGSD